MRVIRRWVLSVAVVIAICAVPAFAACGDDGDGGDGNATFEREGFPFTFEYPDSFELRENVTPAQTLGAESDESDESDDRVALASDDDNLIAVERFTLNVEVDESNLDQAKQEVDQLFQQVDPSAESQPGEIAGLPSLSLDAITVPPPQDGESRITVLFEGDQEYVINCQSTPEKRTEVEAACDLMLETLTVTAERDTTTSTTTTRESPSTTETAVGLIPDELRLGDCFNDSAHGTNEVGEITVVDCGSAHDAEVFAVATLPGEPDAPNPGDDEVDRLSNELCLGEFASYVGIDFLDSAWEFGYFLPTEESWRKYDDRLVVCSLNDPSFNKIEGSKRGSRT